jgi:elongation factor G
MKAIIWDEASQGMKFEYQDIPADCRPSAQKWRENMVEAAAEASEELMNKYLESGELTEDEIKLGIRTRTIATEIQPMFCGTAFKNKGVQRMLDGVIDFMPSPIGHPAGARHRRRRQAGRPQGRPTKRSSPRWPSS